MNIYVEVRNISVYIIKRNQDRNMQNFAVYTVYNTFLVQQWAVELRS